jgi:hypothetical protein
MFIAIPFLAVCATGGNDADDFRVADFHRMGHQQQHTPTSHADSPPALLTKMGSDTIISWIFMSLCRPASADFHSTAADISSDHTNLRAGWGGDRLLKGRAGQTKWCLTPLFSINFRRVFNQ